MGSMLSWAAVFVGEPCGKSTHDRRSTRSRRSCQNCDHLNSCSRDGLVSDAGGVYAFETKRSKPSSC
ncbi:hypothetical protein BN381_50013 [Candidatus Microthrix parvicella RN1]|uniref:Uncharacterized protein n=1 Tax=Candidatus Neomicrothrix parvicella RN1 TaxID=1229780 RepID=R4Z600_9ACTN|nr:hypothetical protein BN381_50013 [Candidatus Microthrix parvicella RN1]